MQIFEWCEFMSLVGSEDTSNDHEAATYHISDASTVTSIRYVLRTQHAYVHVYTYMYLFCNIFN